MPPPGLPPVQMCPLPATNPFGRAFSKPCRGGASLEVAALHRTSHPGATLGAAGEEVLFLPQAWTWERGRRWPQSLAPAHLQWQGFCILPAETAGLGNCIPSAPAPLRILGDSREQLSTCQTIPPPPAQNPLGGSFPNQEGASSWGGKLLSGRGEPWEQGGVCDSFGEARVPAPPTKGSCPAVGPFLPALLQPPCPPGERWDFSVALFGLRRSISLLWEGHTTAACR